MTEVFNTRADRPDAVNVIVVLTDGKTFWDGGKKENKVVGELKNGLNSCPEMMMTHHPP